MKLINKGRPPASLTTYKEQDGASYEDMDEPVKDDLRESLLNEQGWICGYCQQQIKEKAKMKIEHHCEQSICNGQNGSLDRTLDYTNLMAVCMGIAGYDLHCDSQKAKFNSGNGLPIQVSPWINAHINGMSYRSTGKIDSTNVRHADEMNRILSLNTPYLKEQRQTIWIKIFSLSSDGKGGIKRDKMRRLTEDNSRKAGLRYSVSFPGLYEYMLNKFC